jgi:opacity protein-like surface antigen
MKRIVLMFALASLVPAAGPASAQSDFGLKRIGAAVAYVSPEDMDGTLGVGVFADLGKLAPRLALESRLDYWSKSETSFGVDVSLRDVALGARGKYQFPVTNPKLQPFAGAGVGLHFLRAEVALPTLPGFPVMTAEESTTKLGLDLGGGIAMPVSPRTDFLTEAWYGVVSSASQFSLRVGLSYKL